MALVDVYYKGVKIASIPTLKGEKGDKGDKGDPGNNGMTVVNLTESQYAAIAPESGVLYIVTQDS